MLAVLVLAFDVWVFAHFAIRDSLGGAESSSPLEAIRESLDSAYKRTEERKANFKKYLMGVNMPDPAR